MKARTKVGLLVVAWCGAAWAGPAPGVVVREIRTISADVGRYYQGWPTVARKGDGLLMVVYSGGRDAHVCPFGRLESMVSLDDGATWSWPRVLLDSPLDDRDGGLLATAKGTLLATTFSSVGFAKPDRRERYAQSPANWDRFERGGALERLAPAAGPRMLRSEDGGITWSEARPVPANSPHGPFQLADGRLLFAGISSLGKGHFARPGERLVGVWESRDDGVTWSLLSEIPARPGDDPVDYHELHGVEARDGTVVVLIRSHAHGERQMLQAVSRDGGRTWTAPRALGYTGYPPHLLKLRDGRLLLSYDNRTHPFGVQARISGDQGGSWSEPILLTANAVKLDQGYPSTVQLGDGSLLTVWYEVSAGTKKAVIRQAKWELR